MADSIQVRMFGGFSFMYDEKEILLSSNSTLKYMLLLQLMFLKGNQKEQGLSKNQLVTALYEGTDVSNSNNSVNNLLYQLRRQLIKAGLPKGEYIVRSGERYILSPSLQIKVDVCEFEENLKKAEIEKDEKKKTKYYKNAFELYRGELLPRSNTEMWVIVESVRLEEMYKNCVEKLVDYYKCQSDYNELEYIYQRAGKVCPCDRWQIGWIDTLVERGEYKRAYQAYDEMVRNYMTEMGGSPTSEMIRCYERIDKRIQHMPDRMENICKEIAGYAENSDENGGYFCTYRSFIDICQILSRNMERSGSSIFIMVCSMMNYGKRQILDPQTIKENRELFQKIIRECLRKGDVFTQYNGAQYLLLLVGTNHENCENIYRRICRRMKEQAGNYVDVDYVVSSLGTIYS